MTKPSSPRISGNKRAASHKRDEAPALHRALRETRVARGLTQQQLAGRLGVRQRQISDLERAAMDPRLSTVQNVARALDLEVTLIPRRLIPVVEGLQRAGGASPAEAMYSLDQDDDDDEQYRDGRSSEGEPS